MISSTNRMIKFSYQEGNAMIGYIANHDAVSIGVICQLVYDIQYVGFSNWISMRRLCVYLNYKLL